MSIVTKFLALVGGAPTQVAPVAVSAGAASAGGIVGLGPDGYLDPSLNKAPLPVAYAASVALNLATNSNMTMTLTGNLTLANPTSLVPGNVGQIALTQDTTGSRTIAFGTNFLFPGGAVPILSTTAGALDVLFFSVLSSTQILVSAQYAFAA